MPPCSGSYNESTWTNCEGTKTFASGNQYVGEWKEGTQHGQGIYIYSDGDKYVGELKDGKLHGQGTYTWAVGEKYVGGWKDGAQHGQGIYTYPDGRKYVGEWKDGSRNGLGTLTRADGSEKEGIWKDGEDAGAHGIVSETNNLTGNTYRDGNGVLQNYQEALSFYLLSAEAGNKDAMLNIARLYQAEKVTNTLSLTDKISDWWDETDSATSRAHMKAYMWANLAGDDLRDEIAESLTASELKEAQALSSACLKKKYKGC